MSNNGKLLRKIRRYLAVMLAVVLAFPNTTVAQWIGAGVVTAKAEVDTVSITTSPNSSLTVEDSGTAVAEVTRTDGDTETATTVNWSSSDTSVLTIGEDGNWEAVGAGTATITATSTVDNQKTATSEEITVSEKSLNLTISGESTVAVGGSTLALSITGTDKYTAAGGSVEWSASPEGKVTISDGTVTAVAPGTVTITASGAAIEGKYAAWSATKEITVTSPITSVVITEGNTATFKHGESLTLHATVEPLNTTDNKTITWTSSNTSAATIDSSTGVLTWVGEGSTNITAEAGSVTSTACVVTVAKADGVAPSRNAVTPSFDFDMVSAGTNYELGVSNNENEPTEALTDSEGYYDVSSYAKTDSTTYNLYIRSKATDTTEASEWVFWGEIPERATAPESSAFTVNYADEIIEGLDPDEVIFYFYDSENEESYWDYLEDDAMSVSFADAGWNGSTEVTAKLAGIENDKLRSEEVTITLPARAAAPDLSGKTASSTAASITLPTSADSEDADNAWEYSVKAADGSAWSDWMSPSSGKGSLTISSYAVGNETVSISGATKYFYKVRAKATDSAVASSATDGNAFVWTNAAVPTAAEKERVAIDYSAGTLSMTTDAQDTKTYEFCVTEANADSVPDDVTAIGESIGSAGGMSTHAGKKLWIRVKAGESDTYAPSAWALVTTIGAKPDAPVVGNGEGNIMASYANEYIENVANTMEYATGSEYNSWTACTGDTLSFDALELADSEKSLKFRVAATASTFASDASEEALTITGRAAAPTISDTPTSTSDSISLLENNNSELEFRLREYTSEETKYPWLANDGTETSAKDGWVALDDFAGLESSTKYEYQIRTKATSSAPASLTTSEATIYTTAVAPSAEEILGLINFATGTMADEAGMYEYALAANAETATGDVNNLDLVANFPAEEVTSIWVRVKAVSGALEASEWSEEFSLASYIQAAPTVTADYEAETISATAAEGDLAGTTDFEYKPTSGDEEWASFTSGIAIKNLGIELNTTAAFDIRHKGVTTEGSEKLPSKTANISVAARATAPDVSKTDAATLSGAGTLTGLTTAMEYRHGSEGAFAAISADDLTEGALSVEPGTYYVRTVAVTSGSPAVASLAAELVVNVDAPTGLSATKASADSADAEISGVTAHMEISSDNGSTYTAVTLLASPMAFDGENNKITGLAAGTYKIRYFQAENADYTCAAAEVTVSAKADQSAPSSSLFTTTKESSAESDATIAISTIAADTTMQMLEATGWTDLTVSNEQTQTIEGLTAGEYSFRYKATAELNYSPVTKVIVEAKADVAAPSGLTVEVYDTESNPVRYCVKGLVSGKKYDFSVLNINSDPVGYTGFTADGTTLQNDAIIIGNKVIIRYTETDDTNASPDTVLIIKESYELQSVTLSKTSDVRIGDVLSTTVLEAGIPGVTYAWYHAGEGEEPDEAINGAASATYTVATADYNKKIKVVVSKIDDSVFATTTDAVDKKDCTTAATLPAADNITKNDTSLSFTPISGQEYVISATALSAEPADGWVTSGSFSDLKKGTKYYIYTRVKETDDTKAGPMSEAVEATTTGTPDPESVSISPASLSLTVGGTATLTATILPSGAPQDVTWSINEEAEGIVSVSEAGVVTALAAGSATITATAAEGVTATCSVTVSNTPPTPPVVVNVTGVTVAPKTAELMLGETSTTKTVELTATIAPENATDKTVTWSASPADAVSFSSTTANPVTVTALKDGTVTITATTTDGSKTDTATLTISKERVADPVFSPAAGVYTLSQNVIITTATEGATIHYTTDGTNPSASSPAYSAPIPVNEGKVTIKAVAVKEGLDDSNIVSAEYTIDKSATPVTGVSVTPATVSILKGESYKLTAAITPDDADDKTVTWSTSDATKVTVTKDGIITGVAAGTATITATAAGNITGSASVTVTEDAAKEKVIEETDDDTKSDIANDLEGGKLSDLISTDENDKNAVVITDSTGNIKETRVWVGGVETEYTYTGDAITPVPNVYDGTTRLVLKTDYTVSYKNNKKAGNATITVKFKGNYKNDPQTVNFKINPAVIGEDVTVTAAAQEAGKAAKPALTFIMNATGKKISAGKFNVSPADKITIAEGETAEVTVTAKDENFTGEATVTIDAVNKANLLSKGKVTFNPKKYVYTGEAITPSYTVGLGGKTLTEGEDYEVSGIYNNVEPGKGTIVFEGLGDLKGSLTAQFEIKKGMDISSKEVQESNVIEVLVNGQTNASVPYMKGKVTPSVAVYINGTKLTEKTDYTVSFKDNNKVTENATATVKFKGKYKGSETVKFAITKQNLDNLSIVAEDLKAGKGEFYKKAKITITDLNGKKLAKKDYTVGSDFDYDESNGTVSVTVTGAGDYEGEETVTYRVITNDQDISKAKVAKLTDKIYTGKAIELDDDDDLTGKITLGSKTLEPGKDFEILESTYENNVKKGTAKVTIHGIGDLGGSKKVNYKIAVKTIKWNGSYSGGKFNK